MHLFLCVTNGSMVDGIRKAFPHNRVKVRQGHQLNKRLMSLMSYVIYSSVRTDNIQSCTS